jgi:hypothetical protein
VLITQTVNPEPKWKQLALDKPIKSARSCKVRVLKAYSPDPVPICRHVKLDDTAIVSTKMTARLVPLEPLLP